MLAGGRNSTAAPQAFPADVPAGAVLKVAVRDGGIYRLTYDDLGAAGSDPAAVDPRRLTLTNRGGAVALAVPGEEDGVFDASDEILFYGVGIDRGDPNAPYTVENIYWLSAGVEPGLRMGVRNGAPAPGLSAPQSFPTHVHAEVDTFYWRTMSQAGPGERWFWGGLLGPAGAGSVPTRPYTMTLDVPVASAVQAALRVRLHGYTAGAHRTALWVNGASMGEESWEGPGAFDLHVSVPHSVLRPGSNVVTVQALVAEDATDLVLVDWLELDYQAAYRAVDDHLEFRAPAPGRQVFQIGGFRGAQVDVYDVTNPARPVRIVGQQIVPDAGTYALRFADEAVAGSRYVALRADRYLTPVRIVRDSPSALRAPAEGADYLVITHSDFYTAAVALAEHRRDQGLRTATVRVEDIFDEFADGIFNPEAIRDFFAYTFAHWPAPAPKYVVLFGDAFQDYRDALRLGIDNYVPSLLYETQDFGEVSSDVGFTIVAGNDLLPDLQIGRLPVRSPEEAQAVIDKLIAYDEAPEPQMWNRHVILVTDDDEPGFGRLTEKLADRLPFDYAVTRVAAGEYPPGDPTAVIGRAVDAGAALLNYVGHGEYYRWGAWRDGVLLQTSDVAQWTNADRLPVATIANCLSGFFAGPQVSLAEALLIHARGGAVAVWAPGSVGYLAGHARLLDAFYAAVFRDDEHMLGAAVAAAQREVLAEDPAWQELVATYNLLGDPATRLHLSLNRPYVVATAPAAGATDVASDEPVVVTFNKRMDPAALSVSDSAGATYRPTWNADYTRVALEHPGFARGSRVEIVLVDRDVQGNALVSGPQPRDWTFTVSADAQPPTVTLEVFDDETPMVGLRPGHRIVFSEPVRRNSVTLDLAPHTFPDDGDAENEAPVALAWDEQDRRATLGLPTLQADAVYTLTVLAALDRAGNRLAAPVAFRLAPVDVALLFLPIVSK